VQVQDSGWILGKRMFTIETAGSPITLNDL